MVLAVLVGTPGVILFVKNNAPSFEMTTTGFPGGHGVGLPLFNRLCVTLNLPFRKQIVALHHVKEYIEAICARPPLSIFEL